MTIIYGADLFSSYAEANERCELKGERALHPDRNVEHPALILGVRKWVYDHGDDPESWPYLGWLEGLECREHVSVSEKYDLFIFVGRYQ